MRILHIHKRYRRGGGADHYVLETMRHQRGLGHEVGIFSTEHPDNVAPNGPARFVEGRHPELASGAVAKALLALSSLNSGAVERALDGFIAEFAPDVAHLHNYHYHLTPSILRALRRREVPAVHTLHDFHLVCPNHNLFDRRRGAICEDCRGGRFLSPLLRRCRDGSWSRSLVGAAELAMYRHSPLYQEAVQIYLSPSEFLLAKLREMGFAHPHMRHLVNFVDGGAFFPEPKEAPPYFVHFSGLAPHKGVATAIQAMRQTPRARLIVAGEGPAREPAERLAAEWGLGNIEFTGYLSGEPLRRLAARACASLQTSDCYENAPLSVLESYAAGTAVVAPRLGGLPELVMPGKAGDLYEPGDVAGLAGALNSLLDSPERAAEMGRTARALVEERFSPARHMSALDSIYRDARRMRGLSPL